MKLGTRGSELALWQARTVATLIEQMGGPRCEIVVIRTSGDEPPNAPGTPGTPGTLGTGTPGTLGTLGTRGTPGPPGTLETKSVFVKEIEDALLDGRVDLAVHSSKDLPVSLPKGLQVTGVLPREDPRDALLLPRGDRVADLDQLRARLGERPRIGTSSVRRVAQLTAAFPEATFVPIRGNVDTRLRKLDRDEADAIVLAAAGLRRLGLHDRISLLLPIDLSVPAPGQGIVAIETREGDEAVIRAISRVSDQDAMQALAAERAIVRTLGGGCQVPLGAYAQVIGREMGIQAVVISHDGRRALREEITGAIGDSVILGERVAQALLSRGAGNLLRF